MTSRKSPRIAIAGCRSTVANARLTRQRGLLTPTRYSDAVDQDYDDHAAELRNVKS